MAAKEDINIMTTKFENPFRLPSDERVFLMRDEQRRKAREERERLKNMPVWEKTTSSMKQPEARCWQIMHLNFATPPRML